MALAKEKELENGVVVNYHVAEPKVNALTKKTDVIMLQFIDKAARDSGKTFIRRERLPSIDGVYLTGEEVYTAIKESRMVEDEEGNETDGKNNKGSLSWSRNIIMKANKNASNKEYTPPNITAEELAEIYSNHNKCCDICGTPESELKLGLCIDHCHKTGNIRGFLCNPCNIAIGFLGDSQELLEKAKEYLNRDNAGTLTKSSG